MKVSLLSIFLLLCVARGASETTPPAAESATVPPTASAATPNSKATSGQDVIHFANGDRLTGTLVRRDKTQIVFRTAVLGEITLPREGVRIVLASESETIPVEALVGIAPIPEEKETTTAPAKPKKVAAAATNDAPPPPPTADDTSAPPAKKPATDRQPDAAKIAKVGDAPAKDPWKGTREFGMRQQEGSLDVLSFDVRASASRKINRNNLLAKAKLLYGEQDDTVNNDRYDASFQWRRELSERTFAQTLTSYYHNSLTDISSNWEQNIGAGYRLFETEGHVINVGGGITGQYRESTSATGFYALAELFQDYTYKLNSRLTFRQDAQFQYSPEGGTTFITTGESVTSSQESTNYKVRFNTVLQGKITKDLSMNIRFEFEYDNALLPSAGRTDQRIISSIGYAF